jgi:hypothetical protein
MDGKYVGNRPIKLSKIKDDVYGKIDTVSVSGRKVCLLLHLFFICVVSVESHITRERPKPKMENRSEADG